MAAPLPANEPKRMQAVEALQVLDTEADPVFDSIVRIVAELVGTPISLVSIVDRDRQWFKANHGLEDTRSTPREVAFCAHAILEADPLVVPDATLDSRFARNPLVTSAPGIRFYVGCPLVTSDGQAIGTLCALDRVPRTLEPALLGKLQAFAHVVTELLESHAQRRQLEEARAAIALREAQLRSVTDAASVSMAYLSPEWRYLFVNRTMQEWSGRNAQELIGQTPGMLFAGPALATARRAFERAMAGQAATFEATWQGSPGRSIQSTYTPDIGPAGVRGVFAASVDISSRVLAEEARRVTQLRAMNARLRSQVEAEQLRISRALHDQLGQDLTSVHLRLAALRTACAGQPALAPMLDGVLDSLDVASESMRGLVSHLRPPLLDDLGLVAATRILVQRVGEQSGVAVDLTIDGELDPLPMELSTALYRILQEALTNVQKHAGATEVAVRLGGTTGSVRLEVSDNGKGFDPGAVPAGHFGVLTLRERASELGGTAQLDSRPGAGTRLRVELPRGPR